jgi:hypothetical protein
MSNPWAQPYKDLREMDAFAAGGGAAKIAKTGMSRDQVVALGNKNLKAKPAATGNTLSQTAAAASTPTAFSPTPTLQPKPERPPAVGTLGKTSFERRLPTSAELRAAQAERAKQKAAGEDTSSVANAEKALQAAQKTNLPTTGPTPAIPDLKSVNTDLKKANTPEALNKPAPAGSALAAEQEKRKKEMAAKGNPSLLSQTKTEETVIKKYLVREGYISEKKDLPGNQEKIDANKNGKIDADDFKLLRAGKKVAKTAGDITKATLGSEPGNEGKMTKV